MHQLSCKKSSLKVHQVPRKSEQPKENYQHWLTEQSPVNLLFGENFPPSYCVHLWKGNMFLLRAFVWDAACCAIWNRWGFVNYSIAIGRADCVWMLYFSDIEMFSCALVDLSYVCLSQWKLVLRGSRKEANFWVFSVKTLVLCVHMCWTSRGIRLGFSLLEPQNQHHAGRRDLADFTSCVFGTAFL